RGRALEIRIRRVAAVIWKTEFLRRKRAHLLSALQATLQVVRRRGIIEPKRNGLCGSKQCEMPLHRLRVVADRRTAGATDDQRKQRDGQDPAPPHRQQEWKNALR